MRLSTAVQMYLDYKRGLGMKFLSEGFIFAAFCRAIGEVDLTRVQPARMWRFLCPQGRQTRGSEIKYFALRGFYRYAMTRGYVSRSPLPTRLTILPQVLVPHIYTEEELARLLRLASARYRRSPRAEPKVIRTLILLMYGAALRTSEAVGLDMGDVDLDRQLIRVRKTKFYKTRLVPLGRDLARELAAYVADRNRQHSAAPSAPLFVYRKGQRLSDDAARAHFRCLCRLAGLGIQAGAAAEPRLHDLRHSAIVHRVLVWYRKGRDVQALLPKLSTYVGHKDVACTQRYLRLIPELLDQASRRFASHAREVYHHA